MGLGWDLTHAIGITTEPNSFVLCDIHCIYGTNANNEDLDQKLQKGTYDQVLQFLFIKVN